MSLIDDQRVTLHQFFRSGPNQCPYLENQTERKLFTRLAGADKHALNSTLTQAGFRRSHDIIYRPACSNCQACKAARINVQKFKASGSQRRLLNRHKDLHWIKSPAQATPELYELFADYQKKRHSDSDMRFMTYHDFAAMIEEGKTLSYLFTAYQEDTIKAVMFCDEITDGYSAIYSFFDTERPKDSFGNWMILKLVQQAIIENHQHVYLGYWIKNSAKMAYKANYSGLEILTNDGWVDFE